MQLKAAICACLLLLLNAPGLAAGPFSDKPHGKDFSSSVHSHSEVPMPVLPARYLRAVRNAATATEDSISRNLTAILPSNQKLIWTGEGQNRRILMTTCTTRKNYFVSDQQPLGRDFTEQHTVWVTAAPELRDFCSRYQPGKDGKSLTRRLEELLGLPPHSGHRFVIELWVHPKDLFRPSADPEITDHEAQLEFPEVRGFISVSNEYRRWYRTTADARYRPQTGPAYPWTRLGYTYDWGNDKTRVGLSEFVIREGAEISVNSVTPTDDYMISTEP